MGEHSVEIDALREAMRRAVAVGNYVRPQDVLALLDDPERQGGTGKTDLTFGTCEARQGRSGPAAPFLPMTLRVPTDREPGNDGSVLNAGCNYVGVQVIFDPDMSLRGETRHGYGGPVIALREWNEQVFLHELLHVATGYAQPLLIDTYPPHGHDVISRIEVALWETGWRYDPTRVTPPGEGAQ